MPQIIFGGILAVILLGFYVWSIWVAVFVARGEYAKEAFSPDMAFLLNTIGGLVSATVVGVLGATKSGEFPAQRAVERSFKEKIASTAQQVTKFLPSLFILVWIICGVVMVVYGFTTNFEPLTSQAKVWLGTAIGSVYAYFGITPSNGTDQP